MTSLRDDGPMIGALSRSAGGARWSSLVLILVAACLVGFAVATTSLVGLAIAVAPFIVLAGVLAGEAVSARWAWLVPAAIRAAEFAVIIRIATLYPDHVQAVTYTYLLVVGLHYYDIAYRKRVTGGYPARWVRLAGGGWELRLLLVCILSLSPVLAAALIVGTAALAILFLTEIIMFWRGRLRPVPAP